MSLRHLFVCWLLLGFYWQHLQCWETCTQTLREFQAPTWLCSALDDLFTHLDSGKQIHRCVTGFGVKRRADCLATQGVGTGASGRVVGHTLGHYSQTGKMFEWWGVKNQQRCTTQG